MVAEETLPVKTLNVAPELLAATVTEVGSDATAELLLDRVTAIPPAGAAAAKETVPVETPPATTDAGLTAIERRYGLIVNITAFVLP